MRKADREKLKSLVSEHMKSLGAIQKERDNEWILQTKIGAVPCSFYLHDDHQSSPFLHCNMSSWSSAEQKRYGISHKHNLHLSAADSVDFCMTHIRAHINRILHCEPYTETPREPSQEYTGKVNPLRLYDMFGVSDSAAHFFISEGMISVSRSFIFKPSSHIEKLKQFATRYAVRYSAPFKSFVDEAFTVDGYLIEPVSLRNVKCSTVEAITPNVPAVTECQSKMSGVILCAVNPAFIATLKKYCGKLDYYGGPSDRLFAFRKDEEPAEQNLVAVIAAYERP